MNKIQITHYKDGTSSILREKVLFKNLRFYQRSDVVYQLTLVFCNKYFPKYGDRTVDQMIQAARSTKQNIVEGITDGQTSFESEIKLLGIACGSNQELLEDYQDYLKRKGWKEWYKDNPRFEQLHSFCKSHSKYEDYKPLFNKMDDEELANMAICLCHQIDKALTGYIKKKDVEFTTEGGIRERMTAARTEQRTKQKDIIERQKNEIYLLKSENESLKKEIAILKRENERIKSILYNK